MRTLYDIHCHILPNMDDGAVDLDYSLQLAQQAVKNGIQHVIATPHHLNGQYNNEAKVINQAVDLLQETLNKEAIPLTVYPGQEIRINEQLIDLLLGETLQSLDGDGRYYLIELPSQKIPSYTTQVLKAMILKGHTPVIAHPERQSQLMENTTILYEWVSMGCLAQLTSSSYLGCFGQKVQQVSREMLDQNLVHLIATDAHHLKHRPFNLNEAYDLLLKDYGELKVQAFIQTTRNIINGDLVDVSKPQKKKKGLFSFFKR